MIKKVFYIIIIIVAFSLIASCACPPDVVNSKCNESNRLVMETAQPPAVISPIAETVSLPESEHFDQDGETVISLPAYQRWLQGER